MGEWSTSYRWESRTKNGVDRKLGRGRDKRPSAGSMLSHALRSVEKDSGVGRIHSNEKIDNARTEDNVVWIGDPLTPGGVRRYLPGVDSVASVEQRMDDLVATAEHTKTMKDGSIRKVAVRSDATTCMELIVQPDPEWTGDIVDMTPEKRAEAEKVLTAMIDETIRQTGGPENLLAVAEHWDEDHPHAHIFVVPMREKQLVGARLMGANGKEYAARHDEMRSALQEVEYDATFERVDKGRRHQDVRTYKAQRQREKDAEDRDAALAAREAKIQTRETELEQEAASLARRQEIFDRLVDEADEKLDAREADLDSRESDLDRDAETLDRERDREFTEWAGDRMAAFDKKLGDDYTAVVDRAREDMRLAVSSGQIELNKAARKAAREAGDAAPAVYRDAARELGYDSEIMEKVNRNRVNSVSFFATPPSEEQFMRESVGERPQLVDNAIAAAKRGEVGVHGDLASQMIARQRRQRGGRDTGLGR